MMGNVPVQKVLNYQKIHLHVSVLILLNCTTQQLACVLADVVSRTVFLAIATALVRVVWRSIVSLEIDVYHSAESRIVRHVS